MLAAATRAEEGGSNRGRESRIYDLWESMERRLDSQATSATPARCRCYQRVELLGNDSGLQGGLGFRLGATQLAPVQSWEHPEAPISLN